MRQMPDERQERLAFSSFEVPEMHIYRLCDAIQPHDIRILKRVTHTLLSPSMHSFGIFGHFNPPEFVSRSDFLFLNFRHPIKSIALVVNGSHFR
jgi:hypothetical protein